jgi:branched-chain amino acid transport system ATP-binding protein
VMKVSHSILVIHYGQKIAEGTPEEIERNEEVQRVYLGGL